MRENDGVTAMSCGQDGSRSGYFGGESRYGDDRPREECGVFGVFGHEDAAALTALGLHALSIAARKAAAS